MGVHMPQRWRHDGLPARRHGKGSGLLFRHDRSVPAIWPS
ncbi:hypothetical protein SXCC_03072 [Gluconacetobacter sp. SXCC-1]|nr:hypothetical protein SXCC_03072 [Gluconacetobacter sp. SXCC-1]